MNADGRHLLSVTGNSDPSPPIAVDASGAIVTVARFLSDIRALTAILPDGRFVLNLCSDRYRFTVAFFAAALQHQVTLLPPSALSAPIQQLLAEFPGSYVLADGTTLTNEFPGHFPFPQSLESGLPAGALEISEEQIVAVLFTSGSTGAPVPHSRSWGAMVRSSRAAAKALGIANGGGSSVLGTVPHQHSYGLESIVMLALQQGLAFHRDRPLLPGQVVDALRRMPAPRILVTTPIHLRGLLALQEGLPRLDRIICATAPLALDLAHSAEDRFKAPLFEIYGCTEIGQIAVRRPVSSLEWTCIDGIRLEERDQQVWATGEAAARRAPLNDVVELIDESRFVLKGRKVDVVNVAGKRSSLSYLTHQLIAIEGVEDGIFVAPTEGGRLAAYVVAPGMRMEQILDQLRRQLDPAFLPRPLHLVDELPRDPVGKIPRSIIEGLTPSNHEQDDWSSIDYRFAADHPTAEGHFPDNPIIPGALLLDRMLDAISVEQAVNKVRAAKFLLPVRPGDRVRFSWRRVAREVVFECVLVESGRTAMSGRASWATT